MAVEREKRRAQLLIARSGGALVARESRQPVAMLVSDFEDELAELDINPLIVTAERERSAVVDARIRLTAP